MSGSDRVGNGFYLVAELVCGLGSLGLAVFIVSIGTAAEATWVCAIMAHLVLGYICILRIPNARLWVFAGSGVLILATIAFLFLSRPLTNGGVMLVPLLMLSTECVNAASQRIGPIQRRLNSDQVRDAKQD